MSERCIFCMIGIMLHAHTWSNMVKGDVKFHMV